MKKINHPKHGECYELTDSKDIEFAKIAQGATVKKTILLSGNKTPNEDLVIREKYLVREKSVKTSRSEVSSASSKFAKNTSIPSGDMVNINTATPHRTDDGLGFWRKFLFLFDLVDSSGVSRTEESTPVSDRVEKDISYSHRSSTNSGVEKDTSSSYSTSDSSWSSSSGSSGDSGSSGGSGD